jgi:DNA uptake protein ComE-like DNA-binding protein
VDRIHLRREARRIVELDPILANELHIGRADLGRDFDDGGLVDVNHVPLEILAGLPDVSETVARDIVSARDIITRFESIDDLEVLVGVPARSLEHLQDLIIFR